MGKINTALATLNAAFNGIAGMTSSIGRVVFLDTGASLESLVGGLGADGAEALMYVAWSGESQWSNISLNQDSTILLGQMVIRQDKNVSNDMSAFYNMVEEVGKAFNNRTDLPGEPVGASTITLPDETQSGYLWTIFSLECDFKAC